MTTDEPAEIEIDDVEDALRRADEYAELTGRSKADVIADLLDDGQLNQSAGADIEPTKDILDIAQEKAEKLKALLITIAPIIALLSGIGLEGLGVLDITGWGSDSVWEDEPGDEYNSDVWGCTAWDAENFMPDATIDDGTCYWDDHNGGGGGPPDCIEDWSWDRSNAQMPQPDTIRVDAVFEDLQRCDSSFENSLIIVTLLRDGGEYDNEQWNVQQFRERWDESVVWEDLPPGQYSYEVELESSGSMWHNGPWSIGEVQNQCEPNLDSGSATASLIEGTSDIKIDIEVKNEDQECSFETEFQIAVYFNNAYQFTMESNTLETHAVGWGSQFFSFSDPRTANLGEGTWSFETRFIPVDHPEVCCVMTNEVVIEPEPVETHCDENDVSMSGFWSVVRPDNTSVSVSFKIDIADGEEVDCTESFFEIEVRLENSGTVLAGPTNLSELISENQREITVIFEDLNPGDHAPGVWVRYQGELVAQNWLWTVTVPEPEVECAIDFYDFILSYQDNNTEALQFYSDPDEINGCGEQVTVDVVWTLFDENGTETNLEYRLNTTGAAWDQMTLYTENLTLGNYSAEVELFFVIDDERAADPEKVYTWTNIEIKENDEDE